MGMMAENAGKGFAGAPRAWWLSRDMARRRGVDLSQEVALGHLEQAELGGIVSRCGRCRGGAQCAHWLATVDPEADLPDYCPNKAMIENLSDVAVRGDESTSLELSPAPRQKEG